MIKYKIFSKKEKEQDSKKSFKNTSAAYLGYEPSYSRTQEYLDRQVEAAAKSGLVVGATVVRKFVPHKEHEIEEICTDLDDTYGQHKIYFIKLGNCHGQKFNPDELVLVENDPSYKPSKLDGGC